MRLYGDGQPFEPEFYNPASGWRRASREGSSGCSSFLSTGSTLSVAAGPTVRCAGPPRVSVLASRIVRRTTPDDEGETEELDHHDEHNTLIPEQLREAYLCHFYKWKIEVDQMLPVLDDLAKVEGVERKFDRIRRRPRELNCRGQIGKGGSGGSDRRPSEGFGTTEANRGRTGLIKTKFWCE